MNFPVNAGRFFFGFVLLALFACLANASVTVNPKFLFLDGSRRSVSVTVTNPGGEEAEVWVEVKYGYETSDNSGKILIHFDTLAVDEPSAATWIRCYPPRFIVGAGETQTIRIAVRPPAGTGEGEYWARILVTSRLRNISQLSPSGLLSSAKSGINLMTQLSLPFHYRVGKVTTGLQVTSMNASTSDTAIVVSMQLAKVGNAAFWGSRVIKITNESGKVVSTETKNVCVYKTLTLIDRINRTNLPSGTYSVDVEFVTGKRTDLRVSDLVQAPSVHAAASVLIP